MHFHENACISNKIACIFTENAHIFMDLYENVCIFMKMHKNKFSEIGLASSKGLFTKDPMKTLPYPRTREIKISTYSRPTNVFINKHSELG